MFRNSVYSLCCAAVVTCGVGMGMDVNSMLEILPEMTSSNKRVTFKAVAVPQSIKDNADIPEVNDVIQILKEISTVGLTEPRKLGELTTLLLRDYDAREVLFEVLGKDVCSALSCAKIAIASRLLELGRLDFIWVASEFMNPSSSLLTCFLYDGAPLNDKFLKTTGEYLLTLVSLINKNGFVQNSHIAAELTPQPLPSEHYISWGFSKYIK